MNPPQLKISGSVKNLPTTHPAFHCQFAGKVFLVSYYLSTDFLACF
jgi:hypothetical protein